jgi:hypothetical protein
MANLFPVLAPAALDVVDSQEFRAALAATRAFRITFAVVVKNLFTKLLSVLESQWPHFRPDARFALRPKPKLESGVFVEVLLSKRVDFATMVAGAFRRPILRAFLASLRPPLRQAG